MSGPSRETVSATYNAAGDHYDALPFWGYYGERSAARAELHPGEIVLDVCSGTGASAIPAARAVGPSGRVIGLDLAPSLIVFAREKAAAEGMAQVEFRHADFDQAYFRPASFDAAICVFGIFFFPDMRATLLKMWRFLRPGGRLVITTWGADVFEPGNTVFWNAVRDVRPELYKSFQAWDRLRTPERVAGLFEDAGIPIADTVVENRDHPLGGPQDWWKIVMGTGYRATMEQLSPEEREHVHRACLGVTSAAVRTPAVYTIARKR
jgi:ubiquinone/menaquinone biosynthesis C-methylase UbiE